MGLGLQDASATVEIARRKKDSVCHEPMSDTQTVRQGLVIQVKNKRIGLTNGYAKISLFGLMVRDLLQ